LIEPLRSGSQVAAVQLLQYARARQQQRRGKIGGGVRETERQDADCNCFGWELESARRKRN